VAARERRIVEYDVAVREHGIGEVPTVEDDTSEVEIQAPPRDVTTCGVCGRPAGETWRRRRPLGRSRASGVSPSAAGCSRCS
jgi:hypothetical protein